ncbi:hypothetical protein BT67DRAFT_391407 [Trichocladium antarcticum]|uniref:CENP-C homolog n=1 Tax=Trichocladium antarcticum TaxID=1450529 RepID=A0AAN6UCR4_9PEZI|nr:hypothetical protein BT67DRAFT_391407 [Trichocladium antarcticum]
MAPRPSLARRTLAPPGEHIYELGVVGRKTGVTVPDSGFRDEHGMEPLDALFSSPEKSDHDEERDDAASEDDESGDEAMDITTTSGIGPAAMLSGHGRRLPRPLSHVQSPVKSLLNSPAQRIRQIARNSLSPARGAIVRDDDAQSSSQPTRDRAAAKRRLDFRSVENGGLHSLSQPLSGARGGQPGNAKGFPNGRRLQPVEPDDDEEEEGGSEQDVNDDGVNDFVEESMAMLDAEDDHDLPPPREPQEAESEAEEEISMISDDNLPPPIGREQSRQPKQKQKETASMKSAKPAKKPARRVVEQQEEEDEEDPDEGAEDPEDEEEPSPKPQNPAPKRRGRPPKAKAPAAEPQPPARGSKKRRSQDEEESPAPKAPSPESQPKRRRTEPAANSKKPASTRTKASPASKPAPATAKPAKGPSRRRKSSIDAGDVSQVAIARRPPMPKSRGLLISRREAPGDSASMFRTRSGRTSIKPLAYWRNEHVDYGRDAAVDEFASKGRASSSRFVLPSIREVVRVDEPEPEFRPKQGRRGASKKGGGGGSSGAGRRGRRSSGHDDEDDGPAEVWELDPGTVTGEVVVWQPEYEFNPPAPNDLVSVVDKQLAVSGAAITTTEVVGGEFKYAKVFSEGFIGAGVVDLPPGAIKRLKNSRKVFMIFFVHAGRVLVTVQETSFRISKGGIFIVPRYNEYTIENDYDHPARIFFSQGQEMAAKPPPEEQEPEDEDDGDEEVEVFDAEEEGSEED